MKKAKIAEHYDKTAGEYERLYELSYWKLYLDITWENIKRYLPNDKKTPILDAGGGTGYWSRRLADLGYKVTCSDISKGMLEEGRIRAQAVKLDQTIDFVYSDITEMKEFFDDCFSLVLAEGDPVAYCGKPNKAISELARVAKRGAYVIISVDGFYATLRKMIQRHDLKELGRLLETGDTTFSEISAIQHNFTTRELRDIYESNGLEVVDLVGKTVFAEAIPPDDLEKILGNKQLRDKIFKMELKFNNNSSIAGVAGHLEIVGRKR